MYIMSKHGEIWFFSLSPKKKGYSVLFSPHTKCEHAKKCTQCKSMGNLTLLSYPKEKGLFCTLFAAWQDWTKKINGHPGSNRGPSLWEADLTTTTPRNLMNYEAQKIEIIPTCRARQAAAAVFSKKAYAVFSYFYRENLMLICRGNLTLLTLP